MQRLEVSCAVRLICMSLGAKGLTLRKDERKCVTAHHMLTSCVLWSFGLCYRSVWFTKWDTVDFSSSAVHCGHFPDYAVVMFCKFRHMSEFSVRVRTVNSISMYCTREFSWKANSSTLIYDGPQHGCTLVLSFNSILLPFRRISLYFSVGRIRNAFQKLCQFIW